MKIYAKVSSVEKKEIVSENKDGKREKKLLYIAKMGEIGGMRLVAKSEEPFPALFVVGSVISVSMAATQAKLNVTPTTKENGAKPA